MKPSDSSVIKHVENSKLQIVPWYNVKEWRNTFHQVYSEDIELQRKAYTQLCIWKVRHANLPLGVECTMSMLHVKLCDMQGEDSTTINKTPFKDRDLQMLYSTAVMRFLNQLTIMSNCKESMYKMAEHNKIPDWLINLRHEAAHGNSVPALYLLRQARDIILQWLKENYWSAEDEVMQDVIKDPGKEVENYNKNITTLLNLWTVLKMNFWAGRKTIDKIPNEDVRKQAMNLAEEEGTGIQVLNEISPKNVTKKFKTEATLTEIDLSQEKENTGEFTHKIKTAFEPLIRRLFQPLNYKAKKNRRYQNCLIKCLINYKGFCPLIDVEKLSESEILELMSIMSELWKELIEALQAHRVLHHVIEALMLHQLELPMAQLWLRLITQLMLGDPPPRPIGTRAVCQLLAQTVPFEADPEVLLRKVNFHHVDHFRPIELKSPSANEVAVLQKLAKTIVENPTRFSSKYLHSLLRFWDTPLATDTEEKLCALARIYNRQLPYRKRPDQVYTLDSLLDQGLLLKQSEDQSEKDPQNSLQESCIWKLWTGDADWSRCALGALPW